MVFGGIGAGLFGLLTYQIFRALPHAAPSAYNACPLPLRVAGYFFCWNVISSERPSLWPCLRQIFLPISSLQNFVISFSLLMTIGYYLFTCWLVYCTCPLLNGKTRNLSASWAQTRVVLNKWIKSWKRKGPSFKNKQINKKTLVSGAKIALYLQSSHLVGTSSIVWCVLFQLTDEETEAQRGTVSCSNTHQPTYRAKFHTNFFFCPCMFHYSTQPLCRGKLFGFKPQPYTFLTSIL